MAVIKCKMCGGDLELIEGKSVVECEYCGIQQTVPTADNEKKLNLFARANRLRMACEFDKAAGIYESILADFPEEAEAYWGLVLCKYGIEYVDDPATSKKIPTCHRSSFDSVMDDVNLEQALENADVVARKIYREEAKSIEELRKGIIEVSGKEEPYDIFICYKESNEVGERTIDSVIAQDVYDVLTKKGYRVFFSRITLEDKLGQEYEPYIFAALQSSKIMLAFGTDYEYYNAVWVKNEWSRFLQLIAAGQKKTLIPCYKGIDAYDMPKEFARLQAQDMGKVGAIQDLLRGIEKLLPRENVAMKNPILAPQVFHSPAESLIKRGFMALEDQDWRQADTFFEQALNIDAENAEAYLGKTLTMERCPTLDALVIKRIADGCVVNSERRSILEASSHIQKMIDKTNSEGYQLSEAIRQMYNFDLSYQVSGPARARKCEEEETYWSTHRYLFRAVNFAQGETAQLLEAAKKSICSALNKQKMESENTDERVLQALQQRYAAHLSAIDEKIPELCANAKRLENIRKKNAPLQGTIVAAHNHIVCMHSNGTVDAVGFSGLGQCDVEPWTNISAVSAYGAFTAGLREDGTVVLAGNISDNLSHAYHWRKVTAISAGYDHLAGLLGNGTVVAVGNNSYHCCDTNDWRDMIAVSAGVYHTVGLHKDGTVVAIGDNRSGQCTTNDWKNIVAVSAGQSHTVGLRSDGTVVATGNNSQAQCNVENWCDIVAISAGLGHTVGLRSDGTLVSTVQSKTMSAWTGVVAISAKGQRTLALCKDGSVCLEDPFSSSLSVLCASVNNWKLFRSLDTLEQERQEKAPRSMSQDQKLERRRIELEKEKEDITEEQYGLRGFFADRRRKQIRIRLEEINAELEPLHSRRNAALQRTLACLLEEKNSYNSNKWLTQRVTDKINKIRDELKGL